MLRLNRASADNIGRKRFGNQKCRGESVANFFKDAPSVWLVRCPDQKLFALIGEVVTKLMKQREIPPP